MRQGSSVLMPNQLPAMVLVTLHEMGREMRKSVLKALPDVRKSDRRNLSNLLTPNGDLARRDFIESIGHTVRLTAKGRAEAAAQQQLGTQALDQGNKHRGSGDSGDSG